MLEFYANQFAFSDRNFIRTKLNIDYFLEEVMDEDRIDDIYDYFLESETDDLKVAMKELGNEYEEDEVRLVRIKFLSEKAN